MNCIRIFKIAIGLLVLTSLAGVPAFGQVNLAGVWSGRLDEDFPDRLAGPELGDYGGLPINAANRLRAHRGTPGSSDS